jgi:hypothetical protein
MTTSRFLSSLVVALALTSCGSDEPHKAAPPPPRRRTRDAAARRQPRPGSGQARPAPRSRQCVGKWTSGTTGTLTCSGPGQGATFDKAAFRLDRVCVNDPRITTLHAGGKTVTMTLKAEGRQLCATFGGVAEVPESCSCVAPAAATATAAGRLRLCRDRHSAPAGG